MVFEFRFNPWFGSVLAPDPLSRDKPETHPLDVSAHIGAVMSAAYAAETSGTEMLDA